MSSRPALSRELIQQALVYHGRPLQKIWETERRQNELLALGIDANLDYSVYMARQKHFTLQDRAKRLKLQQFMARKANVLYGADTQHSAREPEIDYRQSINHLVRHLPSAPSALSRSNLTAASSPQTVLPGDVVYGTVTMFKNFGGIAFRPLLIVGNVTSFVRNKLIKGTVASDQVLTPDKDPGAPKNYFVNDMICCEVIDVAPDARRLICSMKRTSKSRAPDTVVYGLLSKEDIPEVYKTTLKRKDQNYQYFLDSSPSFNDPNHIEQLYQEVGLDFNEVYTNMSSLKGRYPSQEYAAELRNSQNSKWAFRSVAQGIEHFKEGRHSEAFQCLNKALSMDPRNVEGLVARGALYANSGSFKKAVEDFETALKLNPSHANARKYMGETLVALGRSYEEENRFEEAKKAYQDCLNIIPHHEEAQNSLDFLKSKPFTGKQIVEPTELELPKKERKKRHKKHHSSSSDSSTDSSDSSDSSSDSSSSSSTASTTSSGRLCGSSTNGEFVRKFLEMPRDEENYEEKVRRFVAEASKYQKERKQMEDKSKKKKKKDEKKAKKESKKKRKSDEKKKSKKKDKGGDDDGIAPGGDENAKEGKWRMMFNKDKRPAKEPAPIAATTLTAGLGLKQHPFSNESDEESVGAGPSFTIGGKMPQNDRGTTSSRFGGSGGGASGGGRYGDDRGGPSEKGKAASSTAAQMPAVKSGPVVLDKFGNFRLASADAPSAAGGSKPPEPSAAPPMRRSRSKSRTRNYGSSRSRSRSRSDRRRSRSGSFRRRFSRSRSRSFSRSRSGSYSRSRSRSRSFERRRFDRRFSRWPRGRRRRRRRWRRRRIRRERSSPPTRRSRADSRDNQRDREDSRDRDHRHRRSEDRDSSKRSKDDHAGTAGGGTGGGGAATSASERHDSSPDSPRAEKSSRQQRRSSS
ncbi:AGAP009659-PA, partial [Anopheles gambiae str. PEST]